MNLAFTETISSALRAIHDVSNRWVGGELGGLTRSVNTVRTLLLGTVSDGGPQPNDRRPLLFLAGLDDRVVDGSEIAMNSSAWDPQQPMVDIPVTIVDMEDLPTVGRESPLDVLSKSQAGVSVDRDI